VSTALLVVDFQNDFTIGTLGTPRYAEIAERVNSHIRRHTPLVFASRDWHEPCEGTFEHLVKYGDHGIAGTYGAQFNSSFLSNYVNYVIDKGQHDAGASAFSGVSDGGVTLYDIMKNHGVDELEVCGFVAEICVWESIVDSISLSMLEPKRPWKTVFLPGMTAAIGGDEAMTHVVRGVINSGGLIR
jgi:nicotinamidase/pyrazinamidase